MNTPPIPGPNESLTAVDSDDILRYVNLFMPILNDALRADFQQGKEKFVQGVVASVVALSAINLALSAKYLDEASAAVFFEEGANLGRKLNVPGPDITQPLIRRAASVPLGKEEVHG